MFFPTQSCIRAKALFRFSSELATLHAMGFTDDAVSLTWLQRGWLDRRAKNRLVDWTIHKLVNGN